MTPAATALPDGKAKNAIARTANPIPNALKVCDFIYRAPQHRYWKASDPVPAKVTSVASAATEIEHGTVA